MHRISRAPVLSATRSRTPAGSRSLLRDHFAPRAPRRGASSSSSRAGASRRCGRRRRPWPRSPRRARGTSSSGGRPSCTSGAPSRCRPGRRSSCPSRSRRRRRGAPGAGRARAPASGARVIGLRSAGLLALRLRVLVALQRGRRLRFGFAASGCRGGRLGLGGRPPRLRRSLLGTGSSAAGASAAGLFGGGLLCRRLPRRQASSAAGSSAAGSSAAGSSAAGSSAARLLRRQAASAAGSSARRLFRGLFGLLLVLLFVSHLSLSRACLSLVSDGQDACDLALRQLQARGVLERAGRGLEAQVEQLLARARRARRPARRRSGLAAL